MTATRERPAIAIVTVCEPALILVSKVSWPQPVTLDMMLAGYGFKELYAFLVWAAHKTIGGGVGCSRV